MEDRIKILEFCGYTKIKQYSTLYERINKNGIIHISEVNFKTDWEWLMLAVEQLIFLGYTYKTGQISNQYFAQFLDSNDNIITSVVEKSSIDATYEIVLDLVKYLDKEK